MEDRINQIKRRFVDRLVRDHSRFSEILLNCEAGKFSNEYLSDFQTFAHRTAGLAGSFGFETLGQVAAQLDNALEIRMLNKDYRSFGEEELKVIRDFESCCRRAIEDLSI